MAENWSTALIQNGSVHGVLGYITTYDSDGNAIGAPGYM
jgi:hypothetical protein